MLLSERKSTFDSDPCLQAALHIMELARQTGTERELFILQALKVIRAFPQNLGLIQGYVRSVERRLLPKLINEKYQSQVPDSRVFGGNIHLGNVVENNVPARITTGQLNQNILIYGRTGSGKSNFNMHVIPQIAGLGIKCEIFDFKREYRDLWTLQDCQPMIVLNTSNDKYNPLEPVGNPKGYNQFFWDICQQDFNIRPETKQMLIICTDELYARFGVYNNGKYFPTLYDLYDYLKEKAETANPKIFRGMEVILSIINRLGAMVDCSSGYDLSGFKTVCYEVDNLSEDLRSWIMKLRLKKSYEQGLKYNQRNILRKILVFDEAKMVFGQSRIGEATNYFKDAITQQRALGTGLLISDQNPSELADFIRNNVYGQVCFHLVHPKERRNAAQSLGGTEDFELKIARLAIPNAYISLGHYPYPFLMRIPKSRVTWHIGDGEFDRLMQPVISRLQYIPRYKPVKPAIVITPKVNIPEKPASIPKTDSTGDLFEQWINLLKHIKANPEDNVSKIYDKLGLSRRKGNLIKEQLLENCLIEEEVVHTKERKRPQKRLKLTLKGEEYVKRQRRA
ncbi:DUF87 domain-containing protein [candidate division TA06 bacterium]|nr:DUF87 domain-containing protein [candidate division TA06 bacterium]